MPCPGRYSCLGGCHGKDEWGLPCITKTSSVTANEEANDIDDINEVNEENEIQLNVTNEIEGCNNDMGYLKNCSGSVSFQKKFEKRMKKNF